MYRRRNQKQVQQQEQPVEKKEQPKKEEPVIKYAVPARGDGATAVSDLGCAQMLNTLRNLNYFGTPSTTTYPLTFKYIINTVLSEGFLKGNIDTYNLKSWKADDASTTLFSPINNNWGELYTKTTNYSRSTFCAGDVIYFKTASMSFAYLIDKVYNGDASSNDTTNSVLDYTYPVALDGGREDPNSEVLSSFTTCSGKVYMFKKNAKFSELSSIGIVSKYTSTGEYVSLEPTNASQHVADSSPDGRTAASTDAKYKPTKFPAVPATGSEGQFNLTSGVIVEGWLIYMRSSTDYSTVDIPSSTNLAAVTGDIIKTGPIAITTLANMTLDLGGVIKIPYKSTSATDVKVHYSGNATRFASVPLNSEQY